MNTLWMNQVELRVDVTNLLRRLNPKDLIMIHKLFYEGSSWEETAHFLGVSKQAVHQRFKRLRKRLRAELSK